MRSAALAAALLLASAPAWAEDAAPDPAAVEDAASASAAGLALPTPPPESALPEAATPGPPVRESGPSRWGVLLDAGFPEGASASVMFRPVPQVRFWAGPAWNYVAFGVQGGVAAVPWHFAVTPVLSAEVGRYFGANVSFIATDGQGVPDELKPLLRDMTYTYAAVHAGIEVGSQSGMVFSLRAGLSYLSLDTTGTVTVTDASGAEVRFTDPRVRGTIPSVKLGVQVWF